MAVKLGTISGGEFGGGIDSQSPPNKIPDGYVEDALNADPKPTGAIAKRAGYQGYAGYLPIRVERIESSGTNLTFLLNEALDLAAIRSTPIIAMGRSSNSTGGDITTTDSTHYYPDFQANIRTLIGTGTVTTTIPETVHNINSPAIWVGAALSSAYTHLDNTVIYPSQVSINKATKDISLTTVNGTGSSFSTFLYYADRSQQDTLVYLGSSTTQGATQSLAVGTSTFSIPLAVHQLTSNLILTRVFHDDGTNYVEIEPDNVVVNKLSRQVDVTLTNASASAINIIFSLAYAPAKNYKTGAVATLSSNTVTIDLSTYTDRTNFVFTGCYLDNGTSFTQVIPDSISIDAQNQTMQIVFTDSGAGGANFTIYWQFIPLTIKKLTVTQGSSATYIDTRPQLTLWGLPHDQIYASDENGWSKAWVTHIDSYRSTADSRLVAGLGGNLFAARMSSEGNYLMPTLYPHLQALVQADTLIGPAFWDTSDNPMRSRGYITGSTGASNSFEVKKVEYSAGQIKYTLNVPNMQVVGTLSTIIDTGALPDKITVHDTSYSVHNGTFPIEAVAVGVDELYIWVINSKVDTADYDILGAGGNAGIFTDRLLLSSNPFIIGDKILCDLYAADVSISCYGTTANYVGLDNVVEQLSHPTGLKMLAERSSSVIPMRALDTTRTVSDLVMGDILTHSEVERKLRILNINELDDINISIAAGTGSTAVVTLLSGSTDSIWQNEKILIRAGEIYQGVFEVVSVASASQFTISSAYTDADTAVMVGKTIQIDEVLTYRDSTISDVTFSVDERWIPAEAPDDSFSLTPTTQIHHFEAAGYTDQGFMRSAMVKDSLYLTNGDDEVFKFDGNHIYRAGLPRWTPAVSAVVDTTSTGKIVVDNPDAITTAVSSANIFHLALSDELVFQVGDLLKHSLEPTAAPYRVVEIKPDSASPATKIHVAVDRNIGVLTSGGTLTRISRFKYYFRLNAVDANNAIVASAIVGSDDHVVEIATDAAVHLKMVGLPVFDVYDYSNINIEIYRTKANTTAPFYRVATLPLQFDNGNGAINFLDTAADSDLVDLDSVSTSLEGGELGTQWSEPIRAKYITSAGNKLVLANLTDYPKLDMRLEKNSPVTPGNAFNGYSFLLRKSNTDTGTITDMVNRMVLVWVPISANPFNKAISGISATTSTFTITSAGHGLVAGNWIYAYRDTEGDFDNKFSGWWMVQSATVNTITIAFTQDGTVPTTNVNYFLIGIDDKNDIPVPVGLDGNYGVLNGNRQGPLEFKEMKRMGDAINAVMRQTNTSVISGFKPWVLAHAGSEFNAGQLILQAPQAVQNTYLAVTWTNIPATMSLYINGVKKGAGDKVAARTNLYPSRLIVSYNNFPEIFNNPTALQDINSSSAIDVNPADGQEITALIPFFGDSAFGAALQSGVIVVFKTNSIYLIDLSAKAAGSNAVQRIESQGKGCTAPYSVAVTRDGIMFANEAGIYRLGRNLQIEYIGRKFEGKFKAIADKTQLWNAHGHHDHLDHKYKLSVVSKGQTAPDSVAVYNHVREYETNSQVDGSWTVYDNHPAVGWANLDSDSYFASTTGRVFQKRRTGEVQDYRDDSAAVQMSVILRAMDFGDSGIRKFVKAINTHYRGQDAEGTTLKVALDMIDNFDVTDSFRVSSNADTSGLSDTGALKVETILSTIDKAKGVHFQLKYENSTIDEPLEIVGVDFRVAGLNEKGIRQAPSTKR